MANSHSIDLEEASSQYLSITDAAQTGLDITGDMTIECWVKNESATISGDFRYIISKIKVDDDERSFRIGYYNNAGTPQIDVGISSNGVDAIYLRKNQTLTAGNWFHIAIVYDASAGSIETFVNGSSIGTNTGYPNSIYNGVSDFMIGTHHSTGNYWDGLIDDVRVWSDIRTATEISDNYQKELVGNEANLVGYWKLNNSLLDETSNNNDLTNNNSAVFSTDIPFYSLIASAGSFALTGKDTALNYGKTLIASAGLFTLTGKDTALTSARSIIASAGSFALTGIAATLGYGRSIIASAGSFALTGKDISFSYDKYESGFIKMKNQDQSGIKTLKESDDFTLRSSDQNDIKTLKDNRLQ